MKDIVMTLIDLFVNKKTYPGWDYMAERRR